jgi:hypothetical protein
VYELFHSCTVKKEVAVRIRSIDTSVSFADIFILMFAGFTFLFILFIGIIIGTGSD